MLVKILGVHDTQKDATHKDLMGIVVWWWKVYFHNILGLNPEEDQLSWPRCCAPAVWEIVGTAAVNITWIAELTSRPGYQLF